MEKGKIYGKMKKKRVLGREKRKVRPEAQEKKKSPGQNSGEP